MAKECAICGKTSLMVQRFKKLRGKYNPTVRQRRYPNLQLAVVPVDIERKNFKKFAGKKILMCTKCMKTMRKTK